MFTYEVQFCNLVQDQWQTENVRPAQWAGAHSKTNATCYESAFAEKTHMSFKPGEMAEQGHQKRNNGETASRIESGNAQATRKGKKMAKWAIGCGPGWAAFFLCASSPPGPGCRFLAFSVLIGGGRKQTGILSIKNILCLWK